MEKKIHCKKNTGKEKNKMESIYVFIIAALLVFVVMLFKKCYFDNKLNTFSRYMTSYYYSQENLDTAMKKKLGDIYDDGSFSNFENYICKLVMDDLNQYEADKISKYNAILSKEKSKKVINVLEEPGPVEIKSDEEDNCYIKIADFSKNYTYKKIIENEELINNSKRFIIDLRDNTGGDIAELCKIMSLFYSKGDVVMTEVSDNNVVKHKSKNKNPVNFEKIVFLCNDKTASSSEAMMFNMKSDFKDKISVVGSKTYGKNFSYIYKKFNDGHVLILVSSLMCNSKEETFSEDGIIPDYETDDDHLKLASDILNKS